jgi:predicted phage terminase large subunit-like protein
LQLQTDNPANFANQYLNKPIHSSQQAYTRELLEGAVIKSDDTPGLSQPIIVIDLAVTDTATADDSVIMVGKVDTMGVGYVCDMRGDQWVPIELALNVIDMALRHRPLKVLIEKSAAGMIFADYLKMVARSKNVFLPLDFIKVNNHADAKNMRVVALAGVIKRGKFKFLAGLSKFERLIEQAIEFPKGRNGHDDYPDTAALLYLELSKEMLNLPMQRSIGNPVLAMIRHQEEAMVNVLTAAGQPEANVPDSTGLED